MEDIDYNGLPDAVITATLSPGMGVFEGRMKVHLQSSAGVPPPAVIPHRVAGLDDQGG